MKNSSKTEINLFIPSQHDTMLLDTNILIKLLFPIDFNGKIEKYSTFYEKTKKANSSLIISSVQISEFINRCIRLQFNLYKDSIGQASIDFKKEYRETEDYRNSMKAILEIVTGDILSSFKFIDDGFSNMQYESIFRYGFSYDFNDALLVEIAKKNKAIIVTDDVDFANYGTDVKIVTANKKLLMFS